MAGKSLGTLTIDLVAKVGGFVSGLSQAERSSQKWRKQVQADAKAAAVAFTGFATAASTAAIGVGVAGYNLLKTTSKQITETDRWAKSLNISTQSLLSWQYAAEKAGVSGDQMADIFKDIGDKIGDAVLNKSGEAVDALNALGLSAKKLAGESPDKQLLAISNALGKIKTNAEKTTILESLGNDLSKLLPLLDQGGEKLRQYMDAAKQFGVAPDDADIEKLVKVNSLFEDMETQVNGVKIEIATGLANVDLSGLQNAITDIGDVFKDPQVLQGLTDLVGGVVDLATWLVKVGAEAGKLIDLYKGGKAVGDNASVTDIERRLNNLKADVEDQGFLASFNRIGMDVDGKKAEIAQLERRLSIMKAGNNLPLSQATVGAPPVVRNDYSLGQDETNGKSSPDAGAKKLESAFKSLEMSYQRQIALTDQLNGKTKETTELEKLRFDISTGKLVGINKQQQARLEGLASEIDKYKILEKFRNLQNDLLTPEEKMLEVTRERVKLLKKAKDYGLTNDDDYVKAAQAISDNAFQNVPEFSGIDPMFGGQSGELKKLDKAQEELEEWYSNQLDMLNEYRQSRSDLNEEWDTKELELKKKHDESLQSLNDQRNQLMLSSISDGLGSMVDLTRQAFGEQSAVYRAAFIAQKGAAIAQSMIAIQQGIAMAAANPFPYNLAAMASVAAATAGIVSNISAIGMAHDGIDSVPETGTWLLQKGERVVTSQTSAKLDETLDRVNQQSTGGASFSPVINMNINGDPSDTQISMMKKATAEGAKLGYQQAASDLASGKGDISKAMMRWSTNRRTG
ncbi:phage tail tape measure protein [Citrobacter cronae]|uniref:phage tail tape measure protein n=1 Tax=Citrobacter cronae TaxID=1748967 RepID=UPI001C1251F8|nr:phage tail tape measure protein [Citrobacter cronae]MBU5384739.1 phage tail tape measure protein [Citrobacter cronae]